MIPRAELDRLPGMKQRDIKPCALCGQGVAHDSNFLFWRLRFERLVLDPQAIERQHGLELVLGSAALAFHMGPDRDIAKVLEGPHDALVCDPCVIRLLPGLFEIARAINEKAELAGGGG